VRPTTTGTATTKVGDSTTGPAGNGGGGNGKGIGVASPGCETGMCDDTKTTIDVPPPVTKVEIEKKPVKRVDILEKDAKRISGNSRIEAPNSVKLSMQRAGESSTLGIVKVCVDEKGDVTSAKIAHSTGYGAYDEELVSEMSDWRYEPLIRDDVATPFCTMITLKYVMR